MNKSQFHGAAFTWFTCGIFLASATMMLGQDINAPQIPPGNNIGSASQGSQPKLQVRYPRYTIQCEDVLLLTFALSPELNQTVTVQPDGYISLQGERSIHVQGMTVPEVEEAVRQAYVGILHKPMVNVDLEDFQKPSFTVTGQVGKPGQYELRADISVAEAIGVAGGLQPTAKTQVFLFRRTSDAWFKVEKLNLKHVLNGTDPNENPLIKPGDMVFVPENSITKFRKYVPYTVNLGTYVSGFP